MGMEVFIPIGRKIQEYDKRNGSDLAGFIELIQKKKRGEKLPLAYFKIGVTGKVLNKYGMYGAITANRRVISEKRHSKDAFHSISEELWLEIMEVINEPLAICSYGGSGRSFRVYTSAIIKDKNICVGLNVNSIGRNILVSNISTVFGRDISKLGSGKTEKVLYNKAAGESSSGHDPQIYPRPPLSDAKV